MENVERMTKNLHIIKKDGTRFLITRQQALYRKEKQKSNQKSYKIEEKINELKKLAQEWKHPLVLEKSSFASLYPWSIRIQVGPRPFLSCFLIQKEPSGTQHILRKVYFNWREQKGSPKVSILGKIRNPKELQEVSTLVNKLHDLYWSEEVVHNVENLHFDQ